ncbi:DUF2115 family protein [Sporomusa sp.]|nr:DUF2115 family protein [Sporomusa sp.]HWR09721.1 DUF2115 family protein [Sporomusa sp.]
MTNQQLLQYLADNGQESLQRYFCPVKNKQLPGVPPLCRYCVAEGYI